MVNTLFNKVLGENEKKYVFYFNLKTKGTFWLTWYILSLNQFLDINACTLSPGKGISGG